MNLRIIMLSDSQTPLLSKKYMQHTAQSHFYKTRKCELVYSKRRKKISGYLGTGRRGERDYWVVRKLFGLSEMLMTLTAVMVSQLHTFARTDQIVQFKRGQFTVCPLHFNKAVKNSNKLYTS